MIENDFLFVRLLVWCVLYTVHAVNIFISFASLMCMYIVYNRRERAHLKVSNHTILKTQFLLPHIQTLKYFWHTTKSQAATSIPINTHSIFEFLSIESACDSGRRKWKSQMGKMPNTKRENKIDKSMTAVTQDDDEAFSTVKFEYKMHLCLFMYCAEQRVRCCSFEVASTFAL